MAGTFQYTVDFAADLSNWDVSSVTEMGIVGGGIFRGSKNFQADVSGWDISRVSDIGEAFAKTENFTSDVSSWNMPSLQNMIGTFEASKNFGADVSSWDTSQVDVMTKTFKNAENFQSDVSNWKVSAVTDMGEIFASSTNFAYSAVSAWDTSNVQNFSRAFYNASWLDRLLCWDLSSADPETLTEFSCFTVGGLDCNCTSLPTADLCEILDSDCPPPGQDGDGSGSSSDGGNNGQDSTGGDTASVSAPRKLSWLGVTFFSLLIQVGAA
ncbi:domain protein [Seminavis robusta]|uniref:Domain protein n=1 Tax=Seminavis robusta TaxID=568900 RepID=A0A9N8HC84_9STRA|nr:domain protein [Seminavis robusta]|eukprot:Sro370_g128360.1 domain protein (268) ;mRNA; r:13456-14259